MNDWTGAMAATLVGCPYSNVHVWDRAGVVRPSVRAKGPGTRRRYTFQELLALSVVASVLAGGAPRRVASALAEHVLSRRGLDTPAKATRSAGIWILSDGKTTWELRESAGIGRIRSSAPVAFYAVPLRPVMERLCARILNPPRKKTSRRRRAST